MIIETTDVPVFRPVIERLESHGGPIYMDEDMGLKPLWLDLEGIVALNASEAMDEWLAEVGFGRESLMGRMEMGDPTARFDEGDDAPTYYEAEEECGMCGEWGIYHKIESDLEYGYLCAACGQDDG